MKRLHPVVASNGLAIALALTANAASAGPQLMRIRFIRARCGVIRVICFCSREQGS